MSKSSDGGSVWYEEIGDSGPLRQLANDPRTYILGFVTAFLVENVLRAVGSILGAIGAAFGQLARIPAIIGEGMGALGSAVFGALAELIGALWVVAVTSAEAAGPFGPIVAAVVVFVAAVVAEAVLRWLVRLVGNYVGLT